MADAASFARALSVGSVDLVVTDSWLGWSDGLSILGAVRESRPGAKVMLYASEDDTALAVEAMKSGAAEFVVKSSKGLLQLVRSVRDALGEERSGPEAERVSPAAPPSRQAAAAEEPETERAREAVVKPPPEPVPKDPLTDDPQELLRRVEVVVEAMKSGLMDHLARSSRGLLHLAKSATRALEKAKRQQMSAGDELQRLRLRTGAFEGRLKDLTRSNEDLSFFAHIASHELQEPLRMVEKYGEMLAVEAGTDLGADARESLDYVLDGARRMQRLVDELLAFSRVNSECGEFVVCDVGRLTGQALETLESRVEDSGAEIEVGEMPEVACDPIQFTQVLHNLLSNAIKFRGDEKPKIVVSAEKREDDWVIAVADNGIGMEPKDLKRAFSLFGRIHPELPGTGIGLAISQRIVERHGGRIWAESTPGGGSTFFIALPDLSVKSIPKSKIGG